MNRKKLSLISFAILMALLSLCHTAKCQVGIGGMPSDSSILDLTNANNRYLILPVSTGDPASLLYDNASVIYYKGNLYMKTPQGIKVFTPWKWDGDSTHYISSPSTATVGIGLVPTSSNYKLQLANPGEVISTAAGNASLIAGNPSGTHLLMDNNEIMVKTNSNTPGQLLLQEDGGSVAVRSGNDAGVSTVLTAFGSVDAKGKVKENGKDLLPVGSIIIWSGTTVPAGWALCDGGSYPKEDGSGNMTTPNLLDRFIVGADITGGTGGAVGNYAVEDTGGLNSVALDTTQMPMHNHTGFTTNDTHDHDFSFDQNNGLFDTDGVGTSYDNAITLGDSQYGGFASFSGFEGKMESALQPDTHNHPIRKNGQGLKHENRPPYYALAYIMKL